MRSLDHNPQEVSFQCPILQITRTLDNTELLSAYAPRHHIYYVTLRRSLSGLLIGGIAETQEMLDFCGKHNITADVEVIPIQKVNEAYERLSSADVKYRFSTALKSQ
jgi:uncharacterized zinc-type alcohol dehydrogenase-like protein